MDDWHTNPEERVLDNLYEAAHDSNPGFIYNLYGITLSRPEPVLYIEDPDGNCWEVTARRHIHDA